MKTIDLAQKREECCPTTAGGEKDKGPYYPSAYVHDTKGEMLAVGTEVILRGIVKSSTRSERDGSDKGKKISSSCEVELRSMEVGGTAKANASKERDDEAAVEEGLGKAGESDVQGDD